MNRITSSSRRARACATALVAVALSASTLTASAAAPTTADPPMSGIASEVTIARGTLSTSDGELADDGTVTALGLVWRRGWGQRATHLGRARVASDGSYELRVPAGRLSKVADSEGRIQIELFTTADSQSMFYDYPLDLPEVLTTGRGSDSGEGDRAGGAGSVLDLQVGKGARATPESTAIVTRTPAGQDATDRRTEAASLLRAPGYVTRCIQEMGWFGWRWPKKVKYKKRWHPAQMMVTRGKARAVVAYHKSSTSAFGVAIEASGKGVSAGTSRMRDSTVNYEAGVSQSKTGTSTARADIRYTRLRGYCQSRIDASKGRWMRVYKWAPVKWRGGLKPRKESSSWVCEPRYTTTAGAAKVSLDKSVTFSGFVTLAGTGVDSTVTSAKGVRLRLKAKQEDGLITFCGYKADPAESYLLRETR